MLTSTYFSSPEAEQAAHALVGARNRTAYRLLVGQERWSLSSLRGKARHYGASYARSRDNFYRRLQAAGLQPVTLYVRPHGRRIVVI